MLSIEKTYEQVVGVRSDIHNSIKIKNNVQQISNSYWNECLDQSPKALTYNQIKNVVKNEKYLMIITNREHRVVLSTLRLSDHMLMIEKGRHSRPKIAREDRFCKYCEGKIENEVHFTAECSKYQSERELFFMEVESKVPNFRVLNTNERFIFLFTQEEPNLLKLTAKMLYNWYKIRSEL